VSGLGRHDGNHKYQIFEAQTNIEREAGSTEATNLTRKIIKYFDSEAPYN
jgi:hypothetical protein